jgi:hypothetical protein
MLKHRLSYYLLLIWHDYVTEAPAILFEFLGQWGTPFQIFRKIRVMDPIAETRGYFVATIEHALTLIETVDLVRFNRVQREIHSVIRDRALLGSSYGRPLRTCLVDMRCFYVKDDPDAFIKIVASALVREATFGHLVSKGILRTRRNRLRFDQLCNREARRFLQKVGVEITPWEPEPQRIAFWKHAATTFHGVFGCDYATEAELWKESGIPYKREENEN